MIVGPFPLKCHLSKVFLVTLGFTDRKYEVTSQFLNSAPPEIGATTDCNVIGVYCKQRRKSKYRSSQEGRGERIIWGSRWEVMREW